MVGPPVTITLDTYSLEGSISWLFSAFAQALHQDLVQQGGAGSFGVFMQDALGKLDVLVADQIADDLDLAGRNTREFVIQLLLPSVISPPYFTGSLAAGVAAERAGRHELAQLVTDHVLGDVHADVTAAVVHGEGVTDEGREDRRGCGTRS